MEYYSIPGLTKIRFGGAHPKNISVLNQEHNGEAYLLPSLPPNMTEFKEEHLPKRDFFRECLRAQWFRSNFESVHDFLAALNAGIDAAEDKEGLDSLNWLIDQVINISWRLRKSHKNWASKPEYSKLPEHQKICLDDARADERSEEMARAFLKDFSAWFFKSAYSFGIKISDESLKTLEEEVFLKSIPALL